METEFNEYLGDGVYAGFDGYQVWLKTDNGQEVTNEIALEPEVVESLVKYLSELPAKLKEKYPTL